MTGHNLFYCPYASFTNAQLPLLKVAAEYFDKLVLLDPVGASWNTVGADHIARQTVRQLKDAGILEIVTPATVLAKYEGPMAEAVRRDMADGNCSTCATPTATPPTSNVGRSPRPKVPQEDRPGQAPPDGRLHVRGREGIRSVRQA